MTTPAHAASWVGRVLEVDVGPVAHGGHCVARVDGRVVFVRHAIPGERVQARVTDGHVRSRFLRADAITVVVASADRVAPPCPYAGPGRCGGCDFQHVALDRQRELKAAVVREQLQRLAGLDVPVRVEPVEGDQDGLGWRTRVRWSRSAEGGPGLLRHRSSEVIAVGDCRIAHPGLPDPRPALAAGAAGVTAVVTSTGQTAVVSADGPAQQLTEEAGGRSWRVAAGDFWQVHPGAVGALVPAAIDGLGLQPGERCWDLYSGVGVFSAPLAHAVGAAGAVLAVESHRRASRLAESNLADLPQVRVVPSRVDRFVRSRIAQGRLDAVVLDPPRTGAGRAVVAGIVARQPRAVAYVACDPAAFARDVGTFGTAGYQLRSLRAFDLFPMTHHVECVGILAPSP